ncbi:MULTISPECIES: co-chaperone HscB [Colwellia]|uniref:Co-chaperone protein HscB homolog n=1 Tax=Colwellia psychrerythraea (strain 34H / ATCC BAA-681) TaxID=167879 RepID=HSCB_COLP3|nr:MULTISPECIES: co-chaperone HscB [Colwellia]Q486Y7.1 RecName: Full=Co-chaperone protein HscB homolog [Colwellia psychrerythraea 34H]AAZ28735.1 co-chaperone Hsc20 [Colwellia psychrerythraea 34H]PKH89350.1 co-chaperone protein HscB [Colwellia sp. Bg11-28]
MNYFQLFNIEVSFDVDLQQLSSSYQTLQKTVHPDKFAHASEQEQRIAVQKSAQINDAYQTLKNPLQRAEYILVQRSVEMPNEQHSFQDTSFLMRQMELREMLEDVRHSGDVDAALLEVQSVLSTEYLQLSQVMRTQISENNAASNSAACDNLRKLKFYQKLNIEVDRLEDSLFDD